MQDEFSAAINANQKAFGVELSETAIAGLADYYALVLEHNPLLHLVAPCPPEEFATRHILESLTLLKHLEPRAKFADIGPGAGLPSIPCVLARDDLRATLIESKVKKADFLREAVSRLGLDQRVEIVNRQFEEVIPSNNIAVTCRALDKLVPKLPRLMKWSGKRKLLLFGGPTLEAALKEQAVRYSAELMPMSIQRSLFVLDRS